MAEKIILTAQLTFFFKRFLHMNQYNNCPKALFCDTKPICENDFPNKKM
jgi:hypothetical protein